MECSFKIPCATSEPVSPRFQEKGTHRTPIRRTPADLHPSISVDERRALETRDEPEPSSLPSAPILQTARVHLPPPEQRDA